MLANNIIATPRPRPPAKARRSFSTKLKPSSSSSPPNFRGSVLGSPVSLTAQIAGWDDPQKPRLPTGDSSWINAASREELYDIFTKADDLIKERESELNITSAVCRSLYDHNVALKNKHEALLARIPGTPAQSSTASPVPYMTPLVESPHYYSDSLQDAADSVTNNDTPSSRIRHNRRISVCPLDIALLSDQNAELLDKVEKLESESTQADQVGRRALKKLEKEIRDLRGELERTQAKGDELEEKARAGFGLNAEKMVEEMWKQREERLERIKALRRKPWDIGRDEDGEHEVMDFAPGGAHWNASPPSFPAAKHLPSQMFPTSPPPDINLATKPVSPPQAVTEQYDIESPPSSIASLPKHEYAVVSQLLLKIRELEETNAQIRAQQAATAAKLRAVHRDTRRISKLYECLGDQTGVEWEAEDGQMKNSVASDVIRFQSLRKSLENDLAEPAVDDDDVFKGTVAKNHSTVRGPAALNFNTVKRARKTVVGLFDTPASDPMLPELQTLDTKDTTLSLSLLPPADPDTTRMSWLMGVRSPADSEISLGTQTLAETSTSGPGRTLGSELGSEFGDDWGENVGNHHLRKTSLYELARLSKAQSLPADEPVNPSTPEANSGLQASESMIRDIQFGFDTPTPKPFKGSGQSTRRRINRRLNNTPVKDYEGPAAEMDIARPPTPVMRSSGAFDVLVEAFAGGEPEQDAVAECQSGHEAVEMRPSSATERIVPKEGLARLVLELWLWLQFILIILIFLWAMAKRGPKTVLDEAGHRRTKPGH